MSKLESEVELSIVIPLFNEAACLETNVGTILAYLNSLAVTSEIVLVNDGSRDATDGIAERLASYNPGVRLVSYPHNRGKGHAVKTGMLYARGNYRIFMDADLAVPVGFTSNCLAELQTGVPVVIGSRHLRDSRFKVPEGPLRDFLGKIYRKLTLLCFRLRVSDITCGLKGFSAEATEAIFPRSRVNRWGYDAEIIFLAQKLGYGIAEVPVEWSHSFHSAVNVGRDSVGTFIEMLKIVINYHRKRYDLP